MAIHRLADQVTGFGVGDTIRPTTGGNLEGMLYVTFDGTSFTSQLQVRPDDSFPWLTMATIDESTTAVQAMAVAPQMRLEVLSFTGNTLTIELED